MVHIPVYFLALVVLAHCFFKPFSVLLDCVLFFLPCAYRVIITLS